MSPPGVVFDCNVLLQALISRRGPARACFEAAYAGKATLLISQYILDELKDAALRPRILRKFHHDAEDVDDFIDTLKRFAIFVHDVPHVFDYPRDPDDSHFIDVAIANNAQLIVSRDEDLLSLNDATKPDGRDFALRFPGLRVLTPSQLLALLAAEGQGS